MKAANSRIIKNTGLLYFRLIFLTLIKLYAVRITLESLGQIDYGIYDVIASLVASLSIFTGAMTSATQRFLSFHLGTKDYEKYSMTFSLLLFCFIGIAILLIMIGEVVGIFFIDDWLTIPSDRITAAYWVFQASLLSFAFGFVTIPYMSSIIANERMDAFAIFSIVEGILKLGIAIWLMHHSGDRLLLYGTLVALVTICVFLMQMSFCHSKFKYCRYMWHWDRKIFVDLSKYTGWNLVGSVSALLTTAGQNILLNIFFGPVVNTAKAIADKIRNVLNGFSVNLYLAISPQMVKSYASENYERAINLVLMSSKFSFMLIFVLAFPLLCNINSILEFWLGADSRTPYMAAFSKLILIYSLVLTLEPPITSIIQATGIMKRYQIWVGAITLSYIPITAIVFRIGGSPLMSLIILIAVMVIAQFVRVYIAHGQVGLSYSLYYRKVVIPVIKVSIIALPTYWVVMDWSLHGLWASLILKTLIATIFGLTLVTIFGLDSSDRMLIKDFVMSKLRHSDNSDIESI